jgi:hypothetical protein
VAGVSLALPAKPWQFLLRDILWRWLRIAAMPFQRHYAIRISGVEVHARRKAHPDQNRGRVFDVFAHVKTSKIRILQRYDVLPMPFAAFAALVCSASSRR